MLIRSITIILALLICGCSGKTKEELYGEGLTQISKGNPGGAIVLLKSALEKDQNYFDARYQLAKAYLSIGKYEHSKKEFEKVLRQNPSRFETRIEMGRLFNLIGKPDDAVKEAQECLKLRPDNADAFEILGVAYGKQGRHLEAERFLLKALKINPSQFSAKLQLAVVYNSAGKEGDARRLLNEVIRNDPNNSTPYHLLASLEASSGNRDKALEIYRTISEKNKSDSVALYKSGAIYLDRGEPEKASTLADELIRRFPNRAEGSLLKGMVHYSNKKITEAITELQSSIKKQPTNEAHYFLGLCLYSKGELENSLSQFRRILDNNPSFHRARLLVAMILLKQKRLDESILETKRLLDAEPKNALAHNTLGSALMAKGLYDDGMKELNKALDFDPKIVDAHLKKGLFHLNSGKDREAERDFETAVLVAPEILSTRLLLASYYMRQKNEAKAVALLKQGLIGKKGDAPLLNFLASIMFSRNNRDEGMMYLRKAKEADPDFYNAYLNAASFFASAGQHDKAVNEYREILKRDPLNVKALLSIAALQEIRGNDNDASEMYHKAKETRTVVGFIALANFHLKRKQKEKALSVLDEGIKAIPRNADLLALKGQVLVEEKEYADALKVFSDLESINAEEGLRHKISTFLRKKDYSRAKEQARRMIALKPKSAYGYMMLATVHESENDLNAAMNEIKNGLRVERDNAQAIVMLGNLYERKKDGPAAMEAYADALRKNPDFAPALYSQGALLEASGKKKEAVKKYQAALAKSENFVPVLNNLAYLYLDGYGGSPQEALRLALAGFRQEPSNPAIMDTLGFALLMNGDSANAQPVLEKAAGLLPNNPSVAYHLALAQKANGHKELAGTSLRKALASGEFAEASDARKLLEQLKR